MAMTFEQFLEASKAEVVGGDLIVGILKDRKTVGSIASGTFVLNEHGQELLAQYEGTAPAQEAAPTEETAPAKSKTKAA
jgi:molybdenum-dependent DNA-binding transcriptional regulator ModE